MTSGADECGWGEYAHWKIDPTQIEGPFKPIKVWPEPSDYRVTVREMPPKRRARDQFRRVFRRLNWLRPRPPRIVT